MLDWFCADDPANVARLAVLSLPNTGLPPIQIVSDTVFFAVTSTVPDVIVRELPWLDRATIGKSACFSIRDLTMAALGFRQEANPHEQCVRTRSDLSVVPALWSGCAGQLR
jgi:hypothetical protein